ncbi:MAG: U32 family peptidase [Betaproteobacteria bacterium RIFCSPLOWO2_02_FULL_65_24]|nr:MAG: U32 family peptidase [Betaproteobacteria bacterium RIFCSPLOWO2_02_FULL_65_24]
MKLALGPVLYGWTRQALFDFYERAAASPVDIVYLGEVVCARRGALRYEDWLDIGGRLAAAGKEVVLSTLALMEAEADLRLLRRIADNGRYVVEANDMGAVSVLSERGLPFVAGPHLNVYNAATLGLLCRLGARRWVMPMELSREAFAGMVERQQPPVETELFVLGRVPLAFSARCFTARRRGLEKDTCDIACVDYGDGLVLATRENNQFMVLNGIQTLSHSVYNLVGELSPMRDLGLGVARVSPQSNGCFEALDLLRSAIDGAVAPAQAAAAMPGVLHASMCNGFWHGRPGMTLVPA